MNYHTGKNDEYGYDKNVDMFTFAEPSFPELKQTTSSPSMGVSLNSYHNEYLSSKSKKLMVDHLADKYNLDQKRLMWKVDICVVIPFSILFFVAYLNRTNLGYARNTGIESTLDISSFKVVCGFAAFFTPYILFEVFSNLLLKTVRPHFWLSTTVLLYGAATLATGFVHNYGAFIGCEFLHGLFQAGTETAIFYIMAHYYTRAESQKRFSTFYSISCIAGAAGTTICYAINQNLLGKQGLETWRWLFVIEGIVTMCMAFVLFFIIPDFPEGATFFSDKETLFVIKKLEIYGGKSGYNLKSSARDIIFKAVLDPLILVPALSCFGAFFISYAYAFYEPVLMKLMGLGLSSTNKMSIIPWIISFVWCNLTGFLSDYFKIRFPFVVFNCLLVLAGCLIIIFELSAPGVDYYKYAACYLIVCGSYSVIPIILCWATLNLGGHLRKSIATALLVSCGNAGGLASVFAMNSQKNIRDPSGLVKSGVTPAAVLMGFSIICTCVYIFLIHRENKKKRTAEYKIAFANLTERDQILLGDQNPEFEYLY